ncbi:hypothetical protein ACOME3_008846 [Neoechinorhynchus agilis]
MITKEIVRAGFLRDVFFMPSIGDEIFNSGGVIASGRHSTSHYVKLLLNVIAQTARYVFAPTNEWIARDPDMISHERSIPGDRPLPAMQWDEELMIIVPGTLCAFSWEMSSFASPIWRLGDLHAEISRVILRKDCLQHPAVGIECDRGSIYTPGAFDILGLHDVEGEAGTLPVDDFKF